MSVHFPADYNVFALVTTEKKTCIFPDAKVRQMVSDRIGREFIGTLEMDAIIYTILDLEQMTGKAINWVAGLPFEKVIEKKKALPNLVMRFCTSEMKINPINEFWFKNINEPVEMRIGFRANEHNRAAKMLERCNADGFIYEKIKIGQKENGKNIWKTFKMRKPTFPLIENGIFKDEIDNYWKDKPVRFASRNNCVGCFHRNEIFLNYISSIEPVKFQWFIDIEKEKNKTFKNGITYEKIKNYNMQVELFNEDFNGCDSGSCGI